MKPAPATFFLLFTFFLTPNLIQAQSSDWQLASTEGGVNIHYKVENCQDVSQLFLRVENTNSTALSISFGCTAQIGNQNIPLPGIFTFFQANETKGGGCSDNSSDFISIPIDTNEISLEISNLQILTN